MSDRFLQELAGKLADAATDLRREARRRGDQGRRSPLIKRAQQMDALATTALQESDADAPVARQNRG